MSDWKQKIEAQIAWLAMEPEPKTFMAAQVMRDLLDVAVAAYEYDGTSEDALIKALDKLREVGDD